MTGINYVHLHDTFVNSSLGNGNRDLKRSILCSDKKNKSISPYKLQHLAGTIDLCLLLIFFHGVKKPFNL